MLTQGSRCAPFFRLDPDGETWRQLENNKFFQIFLDAYLLCYFILYICDL